MARLRRHRENTKTAPLPEITMQWTKSQMLNDDRVNDLIEAGVIGCSDTKAQIIKAVNNV